MVDAGEVPGGADEPRPSRPRALVVDDDAGVRVMLGEVLRRAGWESVAVGSFARAVAAAAAGAPVDALIVDFGLPDGDGRDLLKTLRARDGWSRVVACALTGSSDPSAPASARAAGFDLYLAKPPDLARLLAWLGDVARRP